MTISFIAVGKPKARWVSAALADYERFLRKYTKVEWEWLRPYSRSSKTAAQIRTAEAVAIQSVLRRQVAFTVVCDHRGEAMDSEDFARRWRKGLDSHGGHARIIVGGAWGLEAKLIREADLVWSLGPQTMAHELTLVVAAEQIARAFSILRGDSYHK